LWGLWVHRRETFLCIIFESYHSPDFSPSSFSYSHLVVLVSSFLVWLSFRLSLLLHAVLFVKTIYSARFWVFKFIYASFLLDIMKVFSFLLGVASSTFSIIGSANAAPQYVCPSCIPTAAQASALSSSSLAVRSADLAPRSAQVSPIVSSAAPATLVLASSIPVSAASSAAPVAPQSSGKVRFAGVNIAGFDFGCGIDGTCITANAFDVASKGNGIQQMQHFVKDDGLNAFRLPVGWQFLVNNNLGGPLDATNFAAYDKLVQGCITSGAVMCIIDIHNYARWNGMIINQTPGGPTNEQYASLLTQLAAKYRSIPQVAFDIMNEPHDIPDLAAWGNSSQVAVNAIRNAGATGQVILLPGTNFASAETFISSGSADILSKITNPAGGTDGLVSFDLYMASRRSSNHHCSFVGLQPS
jgi:endoglucanase